ncbi:transposase [Actinomadura sp. GTD37]|uniref:transposase n=1 Tax=Actinomadura sp. GTD37 TaxID=1778030 RepID=UPI0035C1D1BF
MLPRSADMVTAIRIIGLAGKPGQFPGNAAFASYAGVAPIKIASADRARHRLSRSGNR